MYISWIGLKRVCERRNIQAPSDKTFSLAVRGKAGFQQTLKRQGRRAAYVQEPFYIELDLKTPRHGDRPFEIGLIDHTELDVEVISAHTGQILGRPWMTLLIDAFSRCVSAFYVTFDAPSYRSCMMILRECMAAKGDWHKSSCWMEDASLTASISKLCWPAMNARKRLDHQPKRDSGPCASACSGSRTRVSFITSPATLR